MTNTVETVGNSLNDVLVRGLESTGGYIEKATTFAAEQAPDVVNQYLRWEFWSNVGLASFFFVLLVICSIVFVKCWKRGQADDWNDASNVFGAFIPAIIALFLVVSITISIYTAAKVKLAPKVYIIEKASTLIRNNR